jgi:hypothetical protein
MEIVENKIPAMRFIEAIIKEYCTIFLGIHVMPGEYPNCGKIARGSLAAAGIIAISYNWIHQCHFSKGRTHR